MSNLSFGVRLSDDEARKRFLRTNAAQTATVHHDQAVSKHALRQSRALAGKLPPVFPSVQTVGCAPKKKFTPR